MINLFEFGLTIKAVDYATGVFKRVQQSVEKLNSSVHATARFREAGQNMAIMGAGIAAVGAAIAVPLKASIEAADALEEARARLTVTLGGNAVAASRLIETARRLSLTNVQSAEDIAQAQGTLVQGLGSIKAASDALQLALNLATGTGMSAAAAGQLLSSGYQNLGDKSVPVQAETASLADKLALLSTRFSSGGAGGAQLARSFAHVAESVKTFGVSTDQALAITGELNRAGLGGGRGAGTYVQQIVEQLGKVDLKTGLPEVTKKFGIELARTSSGGLDLVRTLAMLRHISPEVLREFTSSLGTSGGALTLLMDKLPQLQADQALFTHAQGAAAAAAAARSATLDAQLEKLHHVLSDLAISVGNALLPMLTAVIPQIEAMALWIDNIARAHPKILKFVAVFLAVGAALAIVVGGAIALAGGVLAIGTVFAGASGLIAIFSGIGVAIAAAVAVFALFHAQIVAFFTTLIPNAFNWGVDLIEAFAHGLMSVIGHPIQAVQKLAHMIRGFFPHSPAKEGPLRDLHRAKIVEQIAASIQPAPMMAAIRKVAASAAVAIPMAIGAGVSPALAHPNVAASGSNAAGAVVINYTVNISGAAASSPDEFRKQLDAHADYLVKRIAREQAVKNRTKF